MKTILRLLVSVSLAAAFGVSGYRPPVTQASDSMDVSSIAAARDLRFAPLPALTLVEPPTAPPNLKLLPRQVRENNRRLGYTVKASYPQVAQAKDARAQKFNREIAALLMDEIKGFTKNFRGPEGRNARGDGNNTFDAQYKVEMATDDLVSVRFGISTYFSGAAHPNYESRVFNYDLNAGRTLRLGDLFRPDTRYLDVLSKYCINALKKKLGPDPDEEWIGKGAGPTAENYRNWNVNRKGLVITFDAYQVTSYAAGPQEITVPYSVYQELLRPKPLR
jgi:hypothetical protein